MLIKEANVDDIYVKYKDLKKEHVNSLREWLNKQPHLPHFKGKLFVIFILSLFYVIFPIFF